MKVETVTGRPVMINRHFMIPTKRDADDLIAQLRAAAETVWPESAPCHGEPLPCVECEGNLTRRISPPYHCDTCNGSGENWKYEGGIVAKWYAGPLIEKGGA